jgi:serine phosphatase RsbU (regulator of sigma subunit)/tetratricopeptide (TPR) repeat protein
VFKRLYIFLLACFLIGHTSAQQSVVDSLNKALLAAKQDTLKLIILSELTEKAPDGEWQGYNAKLKEYAEQILALKPSGRVKYIATEALANSISNEGFSHRLRGEYDEAMKLYLKGLKINEQIDNKKGIAGSYNNIATIYQKQGDIQVALDYMKKSLALHQAENNKDGVANLYNNMGSIYNSLGDVKKAIELFQLSLKMREEIGDKADIAVSLNNLAYMLQHQGDGKQAQFYFNKSLLMRKLTGDKYGEATTYNNIGCLYEDMGKSDKANEAFEKGLSLYKELGDKDGVSAIYHNLASNRMRSKKYDEAVEYYLLTIPLKKELNDREGLSLAYSMLATTYLRMGKTEEALKYSTEGFKIANDLGYPVSIKNSADALRKVYLEKGDYKNAYEMYELYNKMDDSTENLANRKAAAKAQLKYEFEKKAVADSLKVVEEKKVSEAKLEQEKTIKYSLYVGLFLVAVFAVFIFNRFKVTQKQNKIIEEQKVIVEEKQKEILDSIQYAQQIQKTLLANHEMANKIIPDSFVMFKPKDIVSGDFYWATSVRSKEFGVESKKIKDSNVSEFRTTNSQLFYLAVCDSTGHGVPGAFMSLLNISFLNEAINEKNILQPNEVFNHVRKRLIDSISQEGRQDGMDGVLICIKENENKISYSAAHNAPLVVRGKEIIHLSADKMPIGKGEKMDSFKLFDFKYEKGDVLYLFTDGFADQFGGPKGKKFRYKQMEELILEVAQKDVQLQRQHFEESFENWKGELEQIDDVCVLGIRL